MDRRFLRAALVGAGLSFLLFLGLVTYGRGALFGQDHLGGFYDAQSRAFLDGHLDVPADSVSFEGFQIGDRTYIYQGPIPSLLRLPVFLVTDRFDGRLTRVSMLAAYAVALAAAVRLGWRTRALVRGDGPVGRFEAAVAGITTFGVGTSSLLFLGSKPWVYHEALLWGAAFALASLTSLVTWLVVPGRGWRGLAWAGAFAGCSILTRVSVGAAPVVALGLVGLGELVALRRPEARTREAWARVLGCALAAGLPLLAYAAINQAKFDSPYRLPIDKQVLVAFDPDRQAALAANDGSLFGLQFAPSVAWQLVRPDAIGLRREFPFLGFPDHRPVVLGDTVFAERDWSSSLPASEPLLVLLALLGAVALVVPDRAAPGSAIRRLRLPVLGAAAGTGGILILGYMANRYLSDALPVLALAGLLGAAVASRWAARRTRAVRTGVVAAMAVLALYGAWCTTSLALQYQREVAPGAPGDARLSWLEWQTRLGPDPAITRIGVDQRLPEPGRIGRIVVVGDCDAVYRSTGGNWQPLGGSPSVGSFDLDVEATGPLPQTTPLLAASGPGGTARLDLEQVEGQAVPTVVTKAPGPDERHYQEGGFPLEPGEPWHLRILMDWRIGYTEVVDVDTGTIVLALVRDFPAAPVEVVAPDELEVHERPAARRACDALGRN